MTRQTQSPVSTIDDPVRTAPSRAGRPWWRRPWMIPLWVVLFFFMLYELPPYLTLDPDKVRVALPPSAPLKFPVLLAHIAFGTIAQVTLVLQVWPWLRRRHPAVHRWLGRTYVFLGALPSALMALYMLPSTPPAGRIGVSMACVLWIVTTIGGYVAARRRQFAKHRRWMIYNFAIVTGINYTGLAIVVVGTSLPVTIDINYLFEAARWVGWVLNLIIATWWLNRTRNRPLAMSPASA